MKGRMTWFCLLVAFLSQATPATSLTYNLNTPFTPAGTGSVLEPSWLTATFEDVAAGVQLTLSASGLPSGFYVTQWYFNIFQNIEIAPPQQLGQSTDPRLQAFLLSPNNLNAGTPADTLGNGFDFLMTFSNSGNLFESQDTATFLFSNPSGILAEWFNQLNTAGSFYVSANAQSGSSAVSWFGATSATTPGPGPVPEPASLILLTVGLAGIGFFGHKRLTN